MSPYLAALISKYFSLPRWLLDWRYWHHTCVSAIADSVARADNIIDCDREWPCDLNCSRNLASFPEVVFQERIPYGLWYVVVINARDGVSDEYR